ncbi:MAG TPA: DMT family transporter [Rhizobiaceae bacterium]|nr:DMT family transporter [Rhizobiaceae bacterium]
MTGKDTSVAGSQLPAILACCFAILLLTTMDAVMKGLVLAIGVYNTMLWRSIFATAVGSVWWGVGKRAWPQRSILMLHIRRGVVIAVVTLFFFWGLGRLPIAEAIAISFIAPLIALYMAAVLLGEKIGRSAIWGSLVGMAGVVVIVAGKFGEAELSEEAVLGIGAILISAVFYAYNLILQRRQAQVAGPREIAFFQNLTLLATLAVAAPWLAIMLPVENITDVTIATAMNLTGMIILTWAFARAEAQYLIPMEYTGFVWAILVGWVFFDESVGWTTIVGAVMIIAGCLVVALTKPKLAEPIEVAAV